MILDKLKRIIEEEDYGEIRIRGYNVKIKLHRDYDFRLKVSHLYKDPKYILQELEKVPLTERDLEYIKRGRAVDSFIKNIWNATASFYKTNKLELDLNSLFDKCCKENEVQLEQDLINLGKKLFSIFSLFASLNFDLIPYSTRFHGTLENIPLNYSGIEPDILLEKGGIKIIGDVKYGIYREDYIYSITAYAMIYEELENEDVDYGILINISRDLQDVKIKLFKISDEKRSRTIELIREKYEEVYQAWKQSS